MKMVKSKNKKTSPASPEPEAVLSPDNYDSEEEFEEVQQTLEKSLSLDGLPT